MQVHHSFDDAQTEPGSLKNSGLLPVLTPFKGSMDEFQRVLRNGRVL